MTSATNQEYQYSFKISEISDWQKFHALSSEWNQLLLDSSTDNYFLTYEWLSIWIRHFCTHSTVYVLTARDPDTGGLLGAAPMVIEQTRNERGLTIKKLVLMGNGCLETDHLDFIIKKGFEDKISRDFGYHIRQQKKCWDVIFFDGLVSSSRALTALLGDSGVDRHLVYTESCPYLPLQDSWETQRQQFGKNLRYNLGRYKRKLEKAYPGLVEFKIVETEEELNRVMPSLYSLHHLIQMSRSEEPGIFEDQVMAGFHNEISRSSLATGNLMLCSLSVEDKVIAVSYCFKYKGSVLFYQTGYDPEWQNYSPGRLLMAFVIENSISDQAKEFDFLRGDEGYKATWTPELRTEARFHLACSLKGQLSLLPLEIRKKLKTRLRNNSRFSSLVQKGSERIKKISQRKK